MLSVGQQVNRYRLDERLDADALSETWRAAFVTTSVPRLLRVALPENGEHFDEWSRVLRHQQRIAHPTRTDVIDLMKIEGRPAAVTDVRKGPSLSTWSRARPRKVGELIALFHQVTSSVRMAHRAGLLHGVLDPRRIIMCNERGPFVPRLDLAFGQLAAVLPLGIPCPEQAAGAPLDERSDIFQLGTVLYEIFARAPFGDPERSIAAVRPDAPPALVALVEALLQPDPAQRPQTSIEVLHALEPLKETIGDDISVR